MLGEIVDSPASSCSARTITVFEPDCQIIYPAGALKEREGGIKIQHQEPQLLAAAEKKGSTSHAMVGAHSMEGCLVLMVDEKLVNRLYGLCSLFLLCLYFYVNAQLWMPAV